MPDGLMGRVTFFNFPITAVPGSPRNPLHVIKNMARPGDFVVFKLDIDFPEAERALMEQLTTDKELHALIDIVYYEGEF